MAHNVETMAYSGEKPWHSLGFEVSNKLTAHEMLVAAKLNWKVDKRPVYFKDKDGNEVQIESHFALTRSGKDYLSTVGTKYKEVQNEEAFDFFTKYVKAGHMEMETAGSLWKGRYIWGLARLGKDFKIGATDEVRGYLLLMSPHVFGKAMIMQTTAIRVVCWNTLNFALGKGLKGDGTGFRLSHATTWNDDVKKQAEVTLGLASEQIVEFQEVATLLSKKKATEPKTEEFFCEVLEWDPKEAKKNKDGEVREPQMLGKLRAALTHAPGHDLSQGSWWSNLNAVTYVIDHESGKSDRSVALKRAWIGSNAEMKRRAMDLAVTYAKQSKAADTKAAA